MPGELNKQLAIKLGYTVYHYDKDRAENCYYSLQDPHGDPVISIFREGERKTEEGAWADTPNFDSDLNLLFEILNRRVYTIHHTVDDIYEVTIERSPFLGSPVDDKSNDLGEAIVKALLKLDFEAEKRAEKVEKLRDQITALHQQINQIEGGA